MLPATKFTLVTKCCGGAIYRERKVVKCQSCQKPASFWRKELGYLSLPISKRSGKPDNALQAVFPPYKPVDTLSHSGREQEAFKRLQFVEDYEISKPIDQAEALFIQERIRWNNERISMLLS
jgi:hypothetical protein